MESEPAVPRISLRIVAGDSWGEINVPVIDARHRRCMQQEASRRIRVRLPLREARAPWTAFLLFAILITVSVGVMNLILADQPALRGG